MLMLAIQNTRSSDPLMMPFWQVSLPSDEVARKTVSRTMLTKVFVVCDQIMLTKVFMLV